MTGSATCAFCNALLPPNAAACPRCGEAVGTAARAAAAPATDTPAAGPSSKRKIIWGALAVVLAVGAGLLWANRHRVRNPFGYPTPPAKNSVVKPAEMAGLGYLPPTTEAVFGVQVPLLLERLGPEAQQDPKKALSVLGLPDALSEIVEKASAVGLKNVDQLVVGLSFEKGAFPPQLVVVVHAKVPFDLDAIAQQHKAQSMKKDGRTLVVTKFTQIIEGYWWKAADRVLVATIAVRDFQDIPGLPKPGIDHLHPAVGTLIRDKVDPESCAWLVASSDRWHRHLGAYTLFPGTPFQGRTDLLKPAEGLRTVAVSIPFDAERSADVQIGLATAEAGAELRGKYTERFRAPDVEVEGDEELIRLKLKNDPTIIRSTLSRLIESKK